MSEWLQDLIANTKPFEPVADLRDYHPIGVGLAIGASCVVRPFGGDLPHHDELGTIQGMREYRHPDGWGCTIVAVKTSATLWHVDASLVRARKTHPYGATAPTNQHTQEDK